MSVSCTCAHESSFWCENIRGLHDFHSSCCIYQRWESTFSSQIRATAYGISEFGFLAMRGFANVSTHQRNSIHEMMALRMNG